MSRRELDEAIALSRNGNVSGALEKIRPTTGKRGTAATRSHSSKRADVAGKEWQDAIRATLELEAAAGRCVYTQGHPRVAGYPGAMFPVEPSTVDFQLLADGIPIAFDAKAFSRETFTLATYVGTEKAIEKIARQIRYLLDFRKQGGIAFLLLHDAALGRAWLVFALQTLLDGGSVQIRSLERAQRGIPARVIDHVPALEPSTRPVGPRWPILEAALRHGRKTLPLLSPWRDQ